MKPRFFHTPAAFRSWLEGHHATDSELLVGFYKKGTGRPSITWPEAVDEALCFGWIDGFRHKYDEESYTVRFTPRRPGSSWSAVNIARAKVLHAAGRLRAAGLLEFERRDEAAAQARRDQRYGAQLDAAQEQHFRGRRRAWAFFQAQAPSYRKMALWWIVSAKRDDTRNRRLATLIEHSEAGLRLDPLRPGGGSKTVR